MGEAAAKEPSMEDILSSIRKIIAEEGEAEPGKLEAEPVMDRPVELKEAEAEAPSSLQDIADKVAAGHTNSDSSMPARQINPPETAATDELPPKVVEPLVVPRQEFAEPKPVETAPKQESSDAGIGGRSLADIAASVRAAEAKDAPSTVQQNSEPVATTVELDVEPVEAMDIPSAVQQERAKEPAEQSPISPGPELIAAPEPSVDGPSVVMSAQTTVSEDVLPATETEETEFKGALMSPSSNNQVSDSFERLKRSVIDDMEAKTEAVLRPMLREWLDENLPNMVERMVREEIERVARG
ncbi:MAG: DUF2497 domain-containing protein [Pseudomonadota bacterium]